jgi:protein-disulfide isomerase/uncharacterized membrane protein YphA (DoxX/SURF4 family)
VNSTTIRAIRPWLGTVVRLGLAAVFLYAGWEKLQDPRAFVRAVRAYQATPEFLSQGIGYGLPVLEICIALLLVFGVITRAAAIVAGSLLVVFLIGIIQAAARGIKLQCGCFGGGGATTGATSYLLDVLRDVGLLVLAVYLIVWSLTKISVDDYLARHDQVAPPSAKRMRTEQGQRKYNAVLEARKREARTRTRYLTTALAILVALISVIGLGVQDNRAKIIGSLTATNASPTNGIAVGKASPVTVDLFEDFQCPDCQQFQQSAGNYVDSLISGGKAQVRFHMVAFLDASSDGNKYSSRAANAGICASDISTAQFLKFHDYLYQTGIQPAEGTNGRTDTQIIGYGQKAGITGTVLATFQTCVESQTHSALVLATTQNWSKRGLSGTPTVLVNGKQLSTSDTTLAGFTKAVNAATAATATAATKK